MLLVLASTSPARLAVLRAAGIEPRTMPPGVDEEGSIAVLEAERGPLPASEVVRTLARLKAEAVVAEVERRAEAEAELADCLVFGGDSAFELDGAVYGKPHRPEVALERWTRQRGRTGVLHSGHCLVRIRGGRAAEAASEVSAATVSFAADVSDAELSAYVDTGEPLAVAGAFTIDGRGAAFIDRIEGDPSTVIGLSIPVLRRLVRRVGGDWPALWTL